MEVWLSFVYTDLPEETIKRSQEVLNLNGHIRSSSLTNSVINCKSLERMLTISTT